MRRGIGRAIVMGITVGLILELSGAAWNEWPVIAVVVLTVLAAALT